MAETEGGEKLVLKDSSLEDWDRIWSGEGHEHGQEQTEGHESGASERESDMFESKVQRWVDESTSQHHPEIRLYNNALHLRSDRNHSRLLTAGMYTVYT